MRFHRAYRRGRSFPGSKKMDPLLYTMRYGAAVDTIVRVLPRRVSFVLVRRLRHVIR